MKRLQALPFEVWLIVLSGALRFVNLGSEKLWFDEAFSAWITKPSTDFWRALVGDDHPPLWSIIETITTRLIGHSEFALRLPAALLSIACVVLVYRIAKYSWLHEPTAKVAGVLAAIMPAGVYFGQDARMYPLLIFGVLLALLGCIQWSKWQIVIGGLIAVYAQNVGVLYMAALGVGTVLGRLPHLMSPVTNKRDFGRLLGLTYWKILISHLRCHRWIWLSFGLVALLWAPWGIVVWKQAHVVAGQFWLPQGLTVGQALEPLVISTMGWRLPDPLPILVYSAAIGVTILGLYLSRLWLNVEARILLFSVVFGAPALLALVSKFWANIYVYRALMPSAVALMIIWASGIADLAKANRRVAVAIMSTALAFGVACHYVGPNARQDVVKFFEPVWANWQPGDAVYHLSATTEITFGWYSPDLPHFVRPSAGTIVTVTDESRAAFGLKMEDLDTLRSEGYHRAWIIYEDSPVNQRDEIDAFTTIQAHGKLIELQPENGFLTTYLYLVEL